MKLKALPKRVTLPSGLRITLSDAKLREAAKHVGGLPPIARAFTVLSTEGAIVAEGGEPVVFEDLSLRDGQLLRALVLRSRIVVEEPRSLDCNNCGERLTFVASEAFEPGPFADGELDDPDLDAPFDFATSYEVPPILTGEGPARTLHLSPRTVGESRVLWEAKGSLDPTRAVVTALGVKDLGRARAAQTIARGLARAGSDAWTRIADLWEEAHYGPRLVAEIICECGARNEYPIPADRELDVLAPLAEASRSDEVPEGFPDEETFANWARAAQEETFERRAVRNIDVIVDYGVPACDDGGVPMLGCYTPPSEGGTLGPTPPEVRLFYRSFLEEKKLDPTFDVRAEVDETVDHEIEHHLHFLSGEDPLDDEERAVIATERARVVGKRELTRRAARSFRDELVGFLRVSFPLVALLVLLAIWRACAS
ncbi:MAG: hypothetical protein HOV80_16825 [Polyangiaceae bacterium]|nr:hypothetical protein [Polyangiaceae bacterium]